MLLAFLLFQHFVAPRFEMGEAAIHAPRAPAVEPGDAARHRLEQPPVMTDHHDAGARCGQFALEPFDAGQVEMVGRFVEQQQVGRGRERLHDRSAARLAARQTARIFVTGKPGLLQQRPCAVGIVAWPKSRLDICQHAWAIAEIRLLGQVPNGGARLHEAPSVEGGEQAGRDLEQGGLARAVAADQADALAGAHGEFGAVEQRSPTEGEMYVLERKKGRRHGRLVAGVRVKGKVGPAMPAATRTPSRAGRGVTASP